MPDTIPFDNETERVDKINENLSLIQLKTGLTFGTDSYLLAAFSRTVKNGACTELGGGVGVVSLLMAARRKYKMINCIEIQPYFANLIRRNAEMNSLSDIVNSICADIRDAVSLSSCAESDSVVSNPPYMRMNSGKCSVSDEMNTARREENGGLGDFIASASRLLKFGGYCTVVYPPERFAELVSSMRENSLEPKRAVFVYPSLSDKPCLVLTEAKKGAAAGLVVSKPLIIYEDKLSGKYTPEMQKIYDDFSLEHLF